jgi:uncharacterized protein
LRCYHQFVPTSRLLILIAVFFLTSVISVVTGSTSLITVPVMIALGIEAHVAVATNMLALTYMSVGASVPFVRGGVVSPNRMPALVAITIVGSSLGAWLLITVPLKALQITIGVVMFGIVLFSFLNPDFGQTHGELSVAPLRRMAGYALTFLLAIYGGFFSGGYVTLLTAVFVICFGVTFIQSVASTKVVNIFSSAVATAIFAYRGIVDLKLGLLLGVVMFVGALLGGRFALSLSSAWLRRIFIAAVFFLAVKMLVPTL